MGYLFGGVDAGGGLLLGAPGARVALNLGRGRLLRVGRSEGTGSRVTVAGMLV